MNIETHPRYRALDDNFEETSLTDEIKLHVIYAALEIPPALGSHIDQPRYHIDRFAYAVEITDEHRLRDLAYPDSRKRAFRYVCTEIESHAENHLHKLLKLEAYEFSRGLEITSPDAAAIIHGWRPNPLIAEFARAYSPFDDRAEDLYRTTKLLGSAAQADRLPNKQPLEDWVRIARSHGVRVTQELQHATGSTDGIPEDVSQGRSRQERELRSAEKKVAYYKARLDAANAKLASLSNRDQDRADATAVVIFDELNSARGKALSTRDVQKLLLDRGVDISHNTWRNQLQRGRAYLEQKQN